VPVPIGMMTPEPYRYEAGCISRSGPWWPCPPASVRRAGRPRPWSRLRCSHPLIAATIERVVQFAALQSSNSGHAEMSVL